VKILTSIEARRALARRPSAHTGLTGTAGEYFVAAELSQRGWLATVTIKNAPGTDVLAQEPTTGAMVAIQTKTASFGNPFQLTKKCEAPASVLNEWYVLVKLHGLAIRPTFFVVPRNIIAGVTYAQHQEWLARPGRAGKPHNDNDRRVLLAKHFADYEDRWDLLEHPANEAPLLLGQWYCECVENFGLPQGHPGWPDA
jgi:hypothetical protein